MSSANELAAPFEAFSVSSSRIPFRERLKQEERRSSSQKKRRDEALSRQQQARFDATSLARKLAYKESTPSDSNERADFVAAPAKEDTTFYAKQLMQPEWMIEVPDDLSTKWFVMARPEGGRCLVIASWGNTVSRQRNGRIQHSFPSWLPGGSQHTLSGTDAFCILDCIFHEPDRTYYILDVMCWKGYALYECSAEFRMFWRDTKLAEAANAAAARGRSKYRFEAVPAYAANADGLSMAHSGPANFVRDGCIFFHKEGHYDTEGPTPLSLLWKDPESSRYFIDTDADGSLQRYQHLTLQCGPGRQVETGDEPPLVMGRIPDDVEEQRLGRLVKFSIREKGISFQDGQFVAADLHYEGLANQRRGRADLFSKIIFQHLARTEPIKLSHFTSGESMKEERGESGADESGMKS